ncbi:hypothetical protein [Polaribacter sp. Hel_I_88]|uniref:hypothetical protein n=1 Tax=Polaribacter sp. Hel_I_88 TaxID=1250006 RepID=UPI00047E8C4C|nr:hypothetical protein [Polaribacter sp. Hel_I_88]
MEDQNFINFKKTRDLGAMISDTIKFLSVEWKPFLGTIIKISIVPVIIAICAVIYFFMTFSDFFVRLADFEENGSFNDLNFSQIFLPLLIFICSYIVAYALMTVSSLAYIKSYISNKGVVNYDEVQKTTQDKFWTYIGLFILVAIIVGFGMIFCILPGVYFAVVLSLSICLVVFKNNGVLDAVSDSFSFIKGHWWETFGILLVIQILIGILGFFAGLPASIYQGADMTTILEGQDPSELLNSFGDPIYLTLVGISYLINFILYLVSTVVIVFIYYDIKEQKNPTSGMINEIGVY